MDGLQKGNKRIQMLDNRIFGLIRDLSIQNKMSNYEIQIR